MFVVSVATMRERSEIITTTGLLNFESRTTGSQIASPKIIRVSSENLNYSIFV